ncbi:hypothetical protein CISIN_1g048081mg, partial [Citrus sinensis]
FLADHNEDIKKVTLKNTPGYNMLIALSIQKDIVRACSIKTTNAIIRDISDALFAILIDKSRDASMKEQMVVVLQYVDRNRFVIERFIGSKHVTSTITISLKEALDQLFSKHGLSISKLCGKDQDILNAIKLVEICKKNLQMMKDDGWDSLLCEISSFYLKHDIDVPDMNDVLCHGVDHDDFSPIELVVLKTQLQTYIMDMRSSTEIARLKEIDNLAKRMVERKIDKVYLLVYLLVTLALVLPVSTATIERTFLVMKLVKNELRNQMGDKWINDNLIVYVEKNVFNSIDIESIAQYFQNMKPHREQS